MDNKFYMTPQEFADLIVDTLEDGNLFKRDQKTHPIDLEASFSTVAFAIANGIYAISKKYDKTYQYNINLSSHNIDNYSEWKKNKDNNVLD